MLKSPNIFQALRWNHVQKICFHSQEIKLDIVGLSFTVNHQLHGFTNRLQLDTNQRISFYECRGKPLIISAAFVNSKPWLLPIDIQSLSSKNILNLEPFLTVYGNLYQLTGYSLNSGNHFTAVIFWYGKKFYYDGMQKKGCCLIPFVEDQLNNKTGSYAYYFITHS